MPSVLIGAGPLRGQNGSFREILLNAGFEALDPPGEGMLTSGDLERWLPGCSAIVAGGERIGPEMLDLAPGLRVIARTGVGYDSVDLPAATARGIVVTITPGTNHESVAEQAFGLLLAVTRRIAVNDRGIRGGGWDRTIVAPIRGRTIGLVGLGRIGAAMVPRARAFGMRVIACDPYLDAAAVAALAVPLLPFEKVVAQADVLSLHCPATAETCRMIGREALDRMPTGSILLNTARGSVVDEPALLEAVESGHLAGAGLDVLAQEPPPADHPFFKVDRIVLSPHLGGIDTMAMTAMADAAARNVVELYAGRWPGEAVVNSELKAGWRW